MAIDMRTTRTPDGVLYEAPRAGWRKFVPFGWSKEKKAAFVQNAKEQERRARADWT